MKKIRSTLILLLGIAIGLFGYAQDRQGLNTANMSRALEALDASNADEMYKYLCQEIESNPTNGYAHALLAYVYEYYEKSGEALSSASSALQYLPKKDKEYRAFVYSTRGDVYMELLSDSTKALEDYCKAISLNPSSEELLQKRLDLYFLLGKYELADKDCHRMIEMNPSSHYGYMGLGRSAKAQGRHKEAIEYYNYVIKLYPANYSSAYSFRAESYLALGMFGEAADDIVTALAIDNDSKAFHLMQQLADSSYLSITMRLKAQKNKSTDKSMWLYYLGIASESSKHYSQAQEWYEESFRTEHNSGAAYRLSNVLEEMGNYPLALQYINQAIELDSNDLEYIMERADINFYLGNTDAAVSDMGIVIKESPTYFGGYYRRGFYLDNMKHYEEAIEDYTTSIVLNPTFAYAYMGRADMYKHLGENALARKDYQKVLELDTVPSLNTCAQYAYEGLGQKEKAKEFNARILEKFPDASAVYYDAACMYSRMGEYEQSLEYLRMAFDKGYTRIAHALMDDDLEPLHDMPEFQRLIQQHQTAQEQAAESLSQSMGIYVEKIAEVPFERRNGVTEVRCSINSLPLYFIFDTGAGDVTISSVEANFMLKNGYLTKKDILGRQNYMTANGEIAEGTVINLNHVEFGGMTLSNVRASVVKSQNAPLLLGQTVLSRLGKIEIDNEKKVLKITYKEEVK